MRLAVLEQGTCDPLDMTERFVPYPAGEQPGQPTGQGGVETETDVRISSGATPCSRRLNISTFVRSVWSIVAFASGSVEVIIWSINAVISGLR
ncbi:hypothetical protein MB901379_00106 [Mycobacterium basiliense]|uniref:Uncharacterized protein n=1 Tax=Mycobacterium basiliense TaxID=2094119 RepID=A0A447G7Y1_9MYCO|nr:hypothetical protein MB901379_00106 [Mycobacterium basiliense]